jgi:carboxypeptidase Taq
MSEDKGGNAKALLAELKTRAAEVDDINRASAVLSWDQATHMPNGGAAGRGRQMATLQRIAHEKGTDPQIGRLLDGLSAWAEKISTDNDDGALVRVVRRGYERSTKVPNSLVGALAEHTAAMYDTWSRARPANDFSMVRPGLEKTVDLSRQLAECFAPYTHVMDPLIDMADYGMRVSSVSAIFGELRSQLVPLVSAVTAQQAADDSVLHKAFPEKKQWDFGMAVAKKIGYDLNRGRQDKTAHPFMTSFGLGDIRITSRFREDDLGDGLFSTMHEVGHALYEQGIDMKYDGLPLADGTSAGVHESQSRLWENLVGRSMGFWEYFYPKLQRKFGKQLNDVPLETFYRAINKVSRSLIRTDADELTYNLHVIIRFDLERQLLEGTLAVKDLPDAWRARYKSDIGIEPPNDSDGCLQDVHWFSGVVGGVFQGYTLGNILSAMFYNAALAANPDIPAQIRAGRFSLLHSWLKKNIYRYGSKYTAPELIERVTGGPLTIAPYMAYLKTKYGALYGLK